ncbi:hypothetical protein F4805DRAFT_434363 [Annulohypoxylon moriforme]|nr:hypothetical protein F4805DRAFT_434363 [Annulohypoxylon moriforme]
MGNRQLVCYLVSVAACRVCGMFNVYCGFCGLCGLSGLLAPERTNTMLLSRHVPAVCRLHDHDSPRAKRDTRSHVVQHPTHELPEGRWKVQDDDIPGFFAGRLSISDRAEKE